MPDITTSFKRLNSAVPGTGYSGSQWNLISICRRDVVTQLENCAQAISGNSRVPLQQLPHQLLGNSRIGVGAEAH